MPNDRGRERIADAPGDGLEPIEALDYIADTLMCDEDNDNPCTAREDLSAENYCNPCHCRAVAWEAVAQWAKTQPDGGLNRPNSLETSHKVQRLLRPED